MRDPYLIPLDILLQEVPGIPTWELPEVMISGIQMDSREVKPGNIFVAIVGGNVDGHRYIAEALERGAVAIVGMEDLDNLPAVRKLYGRNDFLLSMAWLRNFRRQLHGI